MDFSKLSTGDKVIAGSGLLFVISMFLPWWGLDFGDLGSASNSGFDYFLTGWLPLLIVIAMVAIIYVTRFTTTSLPKAPLPWSQIFLIAGGVVAVLLVLRVIIGSSEGRAASRSTSTACGDCGSPCSPPSASAPVGSSRARSPSPSRRRPATTAAPAPRRRLRVARRPRRRPAARRSEPHRSLIGITCEAPLRRGLAASRRPPVPSYCEPMSMNIGGRLRDDPRAQRRAEPRMWVAIAAVGCAVAVIGLFLISGDAQDGDGDGNGSPVTGIVLSLLVVLAGYALMHLLREAPAASAGVTAVILGLPGLALFLTLDADDVPPFSIELFLGLPALVWGISYLVGPGRGRPVLAGFALLFAWLFVLQVVEDPFASEGFGVFEPTIIEDEFGEPAFPEDDFGDVEDEFGDIESQPSFEDSGPSATTIGWISVFFGTAYFVASRLLDKRKLVGLATPFVFAGHVALITGISALSDLGPGGVGAVLVIAGVLVARVGAVSGRRLTTIVGAVEIGLGAVIVLGDAMEESSATSFGVAMFVLGAIVAAVAQLLQISTDEPSQTTPGPSSFPGWAAGNQRVTAGAAGAWGAQQGGPWGGQQGATPGTWAPQPPGVTPGAWAPQPPGTPPGGWAPQPPGAPPGGWAPQPPGSRPERGDAAARGANRAADGRRAAVVRGAVPAPATASAAARARAVDHRTVDHRTVDRPNRRRPNRTSRTVDHRTADHRTVDHRTADHRAGHHGCRRTREPPGGRARGTDGTTRRGVRPDGRRTPGRRRPAGRPAGPADTTVLRSRPGQRTAGFPPQVRGPWAPKLLWDSSRSGQRPLTTSTISWPASVGLRPTSAPAPRRASILAWAVPLPPETMAPAWPIFLPGGAVTPAM